MSWQQQLPTLGRLQEGVPFATRTTLGVGGPARWFFRPAGKAELARAMTLIPPEVPVLPLGRGSNLLVSDCGFDGVAIDLGELNVIRIEKSALSAEAGARMGKVAQQAATRGLSGLEFMATVPGDIGGGIAMNAGAFGQQVSDTLVHIDIVHRNGETERLVAAALEMGYRHTRLPAGALVTAATFNLAPGEAGAIRDRMRHIRETRSASQPLAQPNCGSVFRNPEGDHAARLIEAAGLKGTKIGNARISRTHANFIVNEGGATFADVMALIRTAQQQVEQQFGIRLEPEVRILGDRDEG